MNALTAWLLTLALHGGVLLLAAWAIDASLSSLRGATRELLWRTALFGCALTATLQIALQERHPGALWQLPAVAIATVGGSAPDARASTNVIAPTENASYGAALKVVPASAGAGAIGASGSDTVSGDTPNKAPSRWPMRLLGGWLAGAVLALARLGSGWYRLRRELAQAVPVCDRALTDAAATLAVQAGVPAPPLLVLDTIPSPIAVGGRIILPAWALDTLDHSQLQAMLAHELGHLARRDPQWKLLTAAWRALLWFVPPAAIAQRRLDELAELACDAFAARHTGSGRSLAECLATCAEHHVHGYAFDLAPAMAARQSSLTHRIERLLEGAAMDTNGSGALSRLVAVLAIGAGAVCLPAIGFDAGRAEAATNKDQNTTTHAPDSHSSVSIHSDDDGHDTMSIILSDDEHKFSAKVEGKIEFNADETDVAAIGGDGKATFDETRAGVKRRVELADRNGKLERRYFVDGSERPLDEAGRAWMASVVKQLVRSGIGAEARAKKLYEQGGAPRVLDEIGQIPTDYVRGIYLRVLMDIATLTPGELDRAVKLAGDMHSDYERRQALTAVFDKQALQAPQQVRFLHQALRFESDYERAELLVKIVPRLANASEVRQAWLDAALKVNSDYERRRTLEAMLGRDGLDDTQLASVIDASSSMSSDYEHRELLVAAARRVHDIDAVAPAYARSAQKLGSDYEHREALLALIHAGKLGSSSATAVLDSAAQIKSSYECREVLVALARVMPPDATVLERYRQVARQLPEYDRGQAERALVR